MIRPWNTERSLGLLGATSVGVGAIVGGGILALAGVALAATGPSALVAFALNGLLALLTALSFAEMSAVFPESGGTYTFAKKVFSVEAAFAVGWVVWFASIVAGVLYALGFGYFTTLLLEPFWQVCFGPPPEWLHGRRTVAVLAAAATVFYALVLCCRRKSGAGHWENLGKLVVFAILIAGGLWAVAGRSPQGVRTSLSPFFSGGATGLFQAMGFTFIALQGFDLIAAVAGEIRDPARNIPRAMLLSLAAALAIYLPLLFVVAAAGVEPGRSITAASAENPEAIIAVAARNFLGSFGYWLVIAAGVLSMLSALRANLFAASRVALAMARDRTLPRQLAAMDGRLGTPVAAILTTALILVTTLLLVRDVAAAGAAASLIFLVTFALAHWISVLVRRRGGSGAPAKRVGSRWRVPWFPLVPVVGAVGCVVLAGFQGISVPTAGVVASSWLGLGGVLFLVLFARPARVVDASTEAQDPDVVRLRGRSPLVLVPIANPANAASMVAVANALAPPEVGRVLLLSVAVLPSKWQPGDKVLSVRHAQVVLGNALKASVRMGLFPEALATVAAHPWQEIARIAREHRCESVLLGLSELKEDMAQTPLDELLRTIPCDVVVLRTRQDWRLSDVRRILVPIGGRGWHDRLRARLLGGLFRTGPREVTFLRVLPEDASAQDSDRAARELDRIAQNEARGRSLVKVVRSGSVAEEIARQAAQSDLVILGVRRLGRRQKMFGQITLRIARDTSCAILMISHRG